MILPIGEEEFNYLNFMVIEDIIISTLDLEIFIAQIITSRLHITLLKPVCGTISDWLLIITKVNMHLIFMIIIDRNNGVI